MAAEKIEQISGDLIVCAVSFPNRMISFAILAYGSAFWYPRRNFTPASSTTSRWFYAGLVKDAQRHGVKVKPVCVMSLALHGMDDNTFRLGLRREWIATGHWRTNRTRTKTSTVRLPR
jgi:hypothetical protein